MSKILSFSSCGSSFSTEKLSKYVFNFCTNNDMKFSRNGDFRRYSISLEFSLMAFFAKSAKNTFKY